MPRLITKKEKDLRVQEKIDAVNNLYDLSYEGIKSDLLNLKTFKVDLKLDVTQMSLLNAIDLLDQQMKILKCILEFYKKNLELQTLFERLKQVKVQIVTILKKEFRAVKELTGLRGASL